VDFIIVRAKKKTQPEENRGDQREAKRENGENTREIHGRKDTRS